MPNPQYAGQIEAEVSEIRPLWGELKHKLPGLFLSPRPLIEVEEMDDRCFYIPFDEMPDPKAVAIAIKRLRGAIDSKLDVILSPPKPRSFAGRLLDAIEVRPGIWGFSIDVKALARR